MSQIQSTPNRLITPKNGLRLFAWMTTLFAALSITAWPGDWGHSICGAWGCGPPTQALVGCHLAWFIALIPLAMIAKYSLPKSIGSPHHLGKLLFLTGASLMIAVVLYQWATWWPVASEWQRSFFWQRCGFAIVTSIDIPMLQLFTIGLVMEANGFSARNTNNDTP